MFIICSLSGRLYGTYSILQTELTQHSQYTPTDSTEQSPTEDKSHSAIQQISPC